MESRLHAVQLGCARDFSVGRSAIPNGKTDFNASVRRTGLPSLLLKVVSIIFLLSNGRLFEFLIGRGEIRNHGSPLACLFVLLIHVCTCVVFRPFRGVIRLQLKLSIPSSRFFDLD